MQKRLDQISNVIAGYSFREKMEPARNGNTAVVHIKDITDNLLINTANLSKTSNTKARDEQYLQAGDIVLQTTSSKYSAGIISNMTIPTIAAAPCIIIRIVDTNVVSPLYIRWYLTNGLIQNDILRLATGTYNKKLSKSELSNIEVLVPSIEKQEKIIALAQLASEEQRLLDEIGELKKKYIGGALLKYAKS